MHGSPSNFMPSASAIGSWRLTSEQWFHAVKRVLALSTPTAMFVGLMMLFAYLGKIGRLDLMQSAVASPSGLILLVTWAVLLVLSLTILFFFGLMPIVLAASLYEQPRYIPRSMPWLLAMGSSGWCVLLAMWFMFQFSDTCTLGALGTYSALMVLLGAFVQLGHDWAWKPSLKTGAKRFGKGGIVGLLFAMAMLFSLYAPWVFLLMEPAFGQPKIPLLPTLLLVSTVIPEFFLGYAMFRAIAKGQKHADAQKLVAFSVLGLAVFGLIYVASPINERVLRALGVFTTTSERFIVASDDLASSLKAAGFKIDTGSGSGEVFSARVEFRFGDQLVLCATHEASSAPGNGSASTKAVKLGSAKDMPPLESPSSAPAGTRATKAKSVPTETCLDMHTDDVRRLSKGRTLA